VVSLTEIDSLLLLEMLATRKRASCDS